MEFNNFSSFLFSFPYPPSGLSLDWIYTYERAAGFLIMDTSKTVVREAMQRMYEAFERHVEGLKTGTLVRSSCITQNHFSL
jgi:hypothetical protein